MELDTSVAGSEITDVAGDYVSYVRLEYTRRNGLAVSLFLLVLHEENLTISFVFVPFCDVVFSLEDPHTSSSPRHSWLPGLRDC